MSKLIMAVFVVAGLFHAGIYYVPACHDKNLDWETIESRQRELQRTFDSILLFREELRRISCEISEENLPLSRAIEQLENAGRSYHPIYLRNLNLMKKGKCVKVQIGYNILLHFESLEKNVPEFKKVGLRLRNELREICLANQETPEF